MTLAGSTLEVSPPIDATGQTYTIDYTVTDRTGAAASATRHGDGHRTEAAAADRGTRRGAHDAGRAGVRDRARQRRRSRRPGPDAHRRQRDRRVGHGVGVGRPGRVPARSAGYFGEATFTYTIEDARRTEAGRAVGTVSVTVIGRPGAPSTPQATADNATATVTWALPPANGSPLTDVELQVNDDAPASVGVTSARTLSGLVNGQPYIFRVRAANEAGWGEWSAVLGAGHPRHHARAAVVADGRVRRRAADPDVGGAGQRGLGDHRLRGRDRWRAVGRRRARHRHHVHVDRPAERHELPVPGHGDQRRRPVGSVAVVRSRAPAARARQSRRSRWRRAAIATSTCRGRRRTRTAIRSSSTRSRCARARACGCRSATRTVVPVVEPRQRRRPGVPGPGPQPRPRLERRSAATRARSSRAGPRCSRRRPPPSAPTARPSSPTSTRATRAARSRPCRSAPTAAPRRPPAGRRTRSPVSPTAPATRSTCAPRTRSAWGPWSPASNAVVPAGPPIGPASINASPSGVGGVDLSWPAANANGSRAHAVPDLRQRIGRGRRAGDVDAPGRSGRQHHVLVRRPGVQRRRVRRLVARPPGDDQRTAQPAERPERLGRRRHRRCQLGHAERQRPRGRQLRRRHRSGRLEVGQRHEHVVERHQRHHATGSASGPATRPGCAPWSAWSQNVTTARRRST